MYDRKSSATVCTACANLIVPEGKPPWFRWLCAASKIEPHFNPVTGANDKDQPYALCKNVNGGDCAKFQPGPNILQPRSMPE